MDNILVALVSVWAVVGLVFIAILDKPRSNKLS